MWPWEHLAFGYLCYSLGGRAVGRRDRPTDREAYALVVATQFPDLVDKPLAWTFDILPSGISLAHSLAFAVPFCLLAAALARRRGVPGVDAAVAVGYGSHLAGDGLYPFLTGGEIATSFLFWPFGARPPIEETAFLVEVSRLFASFRAFLVTPRGQAYLVVEGAVLALTLVLWTRDGWPGSGLLNAPWELVKRVRS